MFYQEETDLEQGDMLWCQIRDKPGPLDVCHNARGLPKAKCNVVESKALGVNVNALQTPRNLLSLTTKYYISRQVIERICNSMGL